ncbi:MAG TPA: hypothetical protein VGF12_07205 [Roseateles sp.]|uniref:hypothetical protein n=1 Tax=Roseateles sp. TaxID=1971397 RepID=UPI002ED7B10E
MSRWPHTPDTAPGRLCSERDLDRRIAENAAQGKSDRSLPRNAVPPAYPWRALAAGLLVMFAAIAGAHIVLRILPELATR